MRSGRNKREIFFPPSGKREKQQQQKNNNKNETRLGGTKTSTYTTQRENDHSIALQGMQRASPDHFHARRLVLKDFHRYCTKSLQKVRESKVPNGDSMSDPLASTFFFAERENYPPRNFTYGPNQRGRQNGHSSTSTFKT